MSQYPGHASAEPPSSRDAQYGLHLQPRFVPNATHLATSPHQEDREAWCAGPRPWTSAPPPCGTGKPNLHEANANQSRNAYQSGGGVPLVGLPMQQYLGAAPPGHPPGSLPMEQPMSRNWHASYPMDEAMMSQIPMCMPQAARGHSAAPDAQRDVYSPQLQTLHAPISHCTSFDMMATLEDAMGTRGNPDMQLSDGMGAVCCGTRVHVPQGQAHPPCGNSSQPLPCPPPVRSLQTFPKSQPSQHIHTRSGAQPCSCSQSQAPRLPALQTQFVEREAAGHDEARPAPTILSTYHRQAPPTPSSSPNCSSSESGQLLSGSSGQSPHQSSPAVQHLESQSRSTRECSPSSSMGNVLSTDSESISPSDSLSSAGGPRSSAAAAQGERGCAAASALAAIRGAMLGPSAGPIPGPRNRLTRDRPQEVQGTENPDRWDRKNGTASSNVGPSIRYAVGQRLSVQTSGSEGMGGRVSRGEDSGSCCNRAGSEGGGHGCDDIDDEKRSRARAAASVATAGAALLIEHGRQDGLLGACVCPLHVENVVAKV
jgi:hypothetical protein